jgi:CheY-like chemotaxis protein
VSNQGLMAAQPAQVQPVVLVVEDDDSVRRMMQWALEDEGLTVAVVADGDQALDWLSRSKPALVLLDMGLPLVDGDGVAQQIHERYGTDVPIVVVTADGRAAEKAARVRAVGVLPKPFLIEALVTQVQRILGPASE